MPDPLSMALMFWVGTASFEPKTVRKIESFAELRAGWHFGEGGPISRDRISVAKEFHNTLISLGFTTTDAFPGVNGEIMLAAYVGQRCIEIVIEADDTISLVYEESGQTLLEAGGLTADAARSHLRKIAEAIWNTHASSIHGYTIYSENVLRASRSRTAPEGVSPLFRTDAWPNPMRPYVSTS